MSTFVVENACSLTLIVDDFDDLTLTGENIDVDGNVFTIDALDDNATWDNPQPVDVSIPRWKTDGAIAQTQGFDNRTISFQVVVSADNSTALAAGEREFALRSARVCRLRWLPPQGDPDAVPSDFEVWTWHLEHSFAGLDERYLRRMYTVTMTAKPWATSTTLTTVDAIATPGSPLGATEVDACSSLSGWGGSPNAPTQSSGMVRETVTLSGFGVPKKQVLSLLRTGTITGLDTQPYLALKLSVTGGKVTAWHVYLSGVELAKVGQVGVTSYWQVPTGTTRGFVKVLAEVMPNKGATTVQLACDDVSKTDTIGAIGSRKQLTRSLAVGGSVKTSGSIKVASPSGTGLGTVLVYTQPDNGMGFNPGLRQYRTAGNTPATQSDAVSGFLESLTAGAITFTLAANTVPEASYAVVARVHATAAGTTQIGGSVGTGSVLAQATLGNKVTWASAGYQWVILGVITYPLLSLPQESQVSSLVQLAATGGTGVTLDEAYLLDVTNGDYSLVNAGSYTRLWLDAPDADQSRNRPQVYLGTLDDRSDAVGANTIDQVVALGDHVVYPGGNVLSSVTDNVTNALASWSGYDRWHTHAVT